jgi:hypothetical protein
MILVKSLTYNNINLSIKIKLQTHNVKKKRKSSYTSLEDDPLFLTAAIIDLSPQSKLIN